MTPSIPPSITAPAVPARFLPPIWLLVLCSAIGPLAMTTTVPAHTQIMRDFSADYGHVQLILTTYLLASAISQLVIGVLSDRYGRRPVMLCGLILFTLGSLLCAAAPNLETLLLGRVIQGMGGVVGVTLSRAIVRDIHTRSKSASIIGYVTMAMVVAPMAGPALGGLFTEFMSWHYIFVSMAAFASVLTLLVHFRLNETLPEQPTQRLRLQTSLPQLVKEPAFLGYTLNMAFAAGMFYAYLAGAPYYVMEVLGVSATHYGYYSIWSALGYMIGNFLSGRYAESKGPDYMLKLAIIPGVIGISLLWLLYSVQHPLALFLPMFFITLSNGLTIPNGTAAAISVRPELAGSASGISGAATIMIGSLLTVLVGFIQQEQRWTFLLVMTVSGVLSLLFKTAHYATNPTDEQV